MERRNAMRAAMLPGRDPEVTNSFRRYIDELLAPRDPTRQYGSILPISSDPNVPGSGQFDLRGGVTGDLLGMVGAGARAMRGEAYDPMDITTGLMGVATPSLAARPSASTARIFGGETARGAQNQFRAAREQMRTGRGPEEVYGNTGVFRSPEGRLMFEIDDSAARVQTGKLNKGDADFYEIPTSSKTPLTISDILDHPELYSQYPQISGMPVKPVPVGRENMAGGYNPVTKEMYLAPQNPNEMKRSLLHEIQHGVQDIESFSRGGFPERFLPPNYATLKTENNTSFYRLLDTLKADGVDVSPATLRHALEKEAAGETLFNTERIALNRVKNHPLWNEFSTVLSTDARLRAVEAEAIRKYEGLMGERMARTVEERRGMTAAERRAAIPTIVD